MACFPHFVQPSFFRTLDHQPIYDPSHNGLDTPPQALTKKMPCCWSYGGILSIEVTSFQMIQAYQVDIKLASMPVLIKFFIYLYVCLYCALENQRGVGSLELDLHTVVNLFKSSVLLISLQFLLFLFLSFAKNTCLSYVEAAKLIRLTQIRLLPIPLIS